MNLILENRRLCENPEITKCPCPNELCEWHGCCRECVALHRHYADHVPVCLQSILKDKIEMLVGVAELMAVEKEKMPTEYHLYAKKRDRLSKKAK